jgi:hypothetical protein
MPVTIFRNSSPQALVWGFLFFCRIVIFSAGAPGYDNLGRATTAYSAYVADHIDNSKNNYVWFTLAIRNTNDAPVTTSVAATANEDTEMILTAAQLLANASDVDGDALSISAIDQPSNSRLVDNGDGTYTPTPTPRVQTASATPSAMGMAAQSATRQTSPSPPSTMPPLQQQTITAWTKMK